MLFTSAEREEKDSRRSGLHCVLLFFYVIIYVAMLYKNYPRCGDCAFSASFVRECTNVSYVAGEGKELTVQKKSVVEEIKEVN